MIGASFSMMTVVTVNDPVTPVFTAPSTMTSSNTLGGSGIFSFQFNATKRTASTNTTGSVSGSGASSFQYFNAGALVDTNDYEVMATLGTNVGLSDISTAGGSATLGVWHILSASPLFSFSCSDRRGGSRPLNITVRHRVNNAVTATTTITMNQTSDAVTPSWGGSSGATSVIRTTTDSYLGVYIDSGSSANAGQLRVYKNTSIFSQVGITFGTGPIPEGEYEISASCFTPSPSNGFLISDTGGAYFDMSSLRASIPAFNSGPAYYWSRLGTEPPATGRISVTIRHKLDRSKQANRIFDFSAS